MFDVFDLVKILLVVFLFCLENGKEIVVFVFLMVEEIVIYNVFVFYYVILIVNYIFSMFLLLNIFDNMYF